MRLAGAKNDGSAVPPSYEMLVKGGPYLADSKRYSISYAMRSQHPAKPPRRVRPVASARPSPASRSSLGAASALTFQPTASRCWRNWCPDSWSLSQQMAKAHDSISLSTRRKSTGWNSRSMCNRTVAFAALRWRTGTVSDWPSTLPETRAEVIDHIAGLVASNGADDVRWSRGAYWDTRSSAPGTSGSKATPSKHAQAATAFPISPCSATAARSA